MTRVLFVCLGNICRSPLAEGIMLHLIKKHLLNDLYIDSAGTASYHLGESPDNRTITNARKNGVDLSTLRARQFAKADFENFDHILVMDRSNYNNVLRLSSGDTEQKKVKLFLEFAGKGRNKEVSDPYYGGEKEFEEVFQTVYDACQNLCEKLGHPLLHK